MLPPTQTTLSSSKIALLASFKASLEGTKYFVLQYLDQIVDNFKNRPLDAEYPFLIVDATYLKVRDNHRIISKALFVSTFNNFIAFAFMYEVLGKCGPAHKSLNSAFPSLSLVI